MLNVANGDRHTPNCVNLPVQANDAVHEVPPYVSGVLLSAEKTHSNTSVSQVCWRRPETEPVLEVVPK